MIYQGNISKRCRRTQNSSKRQGLKTPQFITYSSLYTEYVNYHQCSYYCSGQYLCCLPPTNVPPHSSEPARQHHETEVGPGSAVAEQSLVPGQLPGVDHVGQRRPLVSLGAVHLPAAERSSGAAGRAAPHHTEASSEGGDGRTGPGLAHRSDLGKDRQYVSFVSGLTRLQRPVLGSSLSTLLWTTRPSVPPTT